MEWIYMNPNPSSSDSVVYADKLDQDQTAGCGL